MATGAGPRWGPPSPACLREAPQEPTSERDGWLSAAGNRGPRGWGASRGHGSLPTCPALSARPADSLAAKAPPAEQGRYGKRPSLALNKLEIKGRRRESRGQRRLSRGRGAGLVSRGAREGVGGQDQALRSGVLAEEENSALRNSGKLPAQCSHSVRPFRPGLPPAEQAIRPLSTPSPSSTHSELPSPAISRGGCVETAAPRSAA